MSLDSTRTPLAASTRMGTVDLAVADLAAVRAFYERGAGLTTLSDDGATVVLGLGSTAVVTLTHAPGLRLPSRRDAGLFHTAILYATRQELAAALVTMFSRYGESYEGSADHLVSNAFYFHDPEGNGVELYWDRPREQWTWDGSHVRMATLPLDPNDFVVNALTEAGVDVGPGALDALPALGAQAAGTLGHVHLQVGDVAQAREFYVDAVGFDETARYADRALFVSAGGYHHHMAMNTWNSRGAGRRGPSLGLGRVDVLVPSAADLESARARLSERRLAFDDDGARISVRDPWANLLTLAVG